MARTRERLLPPDRAIPPVRLIIRPRPDRRFKSCPRNQFQRGVWVYVIQNADHRFYVGITTALEQRIEDHNTGVSKWTMHRGPWRLVWSRGCATLSEARKLESKLKRQGRGNGFYRMTGLSRPSGS